MGGGFVRLEGEGGGWFCRERGSSRGWGGGGATCTSEACSEGALSSPQRGALLREYSVGPTIGEGSFGVVASCRRRATREEFAVKLVDKVETPVESIVQEIDVLRSVDHPNVVSLIGVFHEKCFVCIVMVKYAGGDLVRGIQRHFEEKGRVCCYESRHLMRQMGDGVCHLHSKGIVHRDVKAENFLLDRLDMVDPGCRVALSDFGTARWASATERRRSGGPPSS
ncbi:unnamed protein product [Prorocentrum cordatum]|uniref:Protein kinase domain-containing protein n=1 Tax=Prorocentrum cordatum TaxID=2364126 RepID=A0ABN9VEC4_9DINO|nr:unnamed protein product [Polarella glacialis]